MSTTRTATQTMEIQAFFDPVSSTWSYVVGDTATGRCAVVDPVLDLDMVSGKLSAAGADKLIAYIGRKNFELEWILETHIHADHLTAAQYLKRKLGGKIGIGGKVGVVQASFKSVFDVESDFRADGSQYDRLFEDGDTFMVGGLEFRVMHTPGHTPACVVYVAGGNAFVGDTLFMPDYGTARTDFPGGDAETLYDSIERILSLPGSTKLYLCHDYLAEGRSEHAFVTTVDAQRESNVHLVGNDKSSFARTRRTRDAELAAPRLLLPSIQVNMRAGQLPPAERNNTRYLKIPLKPELDL